MTARPCPLCTIPKQKQYCAPCLREGVADHTVVARQLKAATDKAFSHAEHLLHGPITSGSSSTPLKGATEWRELRAGVAAAEDRCAALRAQIAAKKRAIKEVRDKVVKSDVEAREEVLTAARRGHLNADDLRAQIALVKQQQREVGKRIIQARRVLVREVVDVFGVQPVQRGHRGQRDTVWQIAGIDLPQPEEFRLSPSVLINGAFVHTIHLLSLITHYLSVALPFIPTYVTPSGVPGTPHIGRPQMRPNTPFLPTTKWRDKHVLWMSSTAYVKKSDMNRSAIQTTLGRSFKKHTATLETFALLAHSIAYLAYTQGVPGIGIRDTVSVRDSDDDDELPPPDAFGILISPSSVLELIALTAESPTLGCRAHEPGTSDILNHMGFGIDVKLVVRAVLKAEKAKWGGRDGYGDGNEELSEGWEVMDAEM